MGPPAGPVGQLAYLREQMGRERRIGLVVWDPRPITKLPYFFRLAVQSGVDTVWICGFPFRQMNRDQKQALLTQASNMGLRTIGFIDGNWDWPEKREFVEYHYKDLTTQLAQLDTGKLQIAFAVNVEPYAIPADLREKGVMWDGNLSSYMDLLEDIVLPKIEAFAKKKVIPGRGSVVESPALLRFEPWWFGNGRVTENGTRIYGLRPLKNTALAGMTYRNTSAELYSFSEILRKRSMLENVYFHIGVETIPTSVSKTPSFAGKEILIGDALLEAVRRFSGEETERFGGVYIHTKDPYEAYRILSVIVHAKKIEPIQRTGTRPPRVITN